MNGGLPVSLRPSQVSPHSSGRTASVDMIRLPQDSFLSSPAPRGSEGHRIWSSRMTSSHAICGKQPSQFLVFVFGDGGRLHDDAQMRIQRGQNVSNHAQKQELWADACAPIAHQMCFIDDEGGEGNRMREKISTPGGAKRWREQLLWSAAQQIDFILQQFVDNRPGSSDQRSSKRVWILWAQKRSSRRLRAGRPSTQ